MKLGIAISLLIGQFAWGWSAEGHRAVADVAESILMQSGKYATVKTILGDLTLSDIATCPNELREFQRNHNVPMSTPCQKVFGASAPTGTEAGITSTYRFRWTRPAIATSRTLAETRAW